MLQEIALNMHTTALLTSNHEEIAFGQNLKTPINPKDDITVELVFFIKLAESLILRSLCLPKQFVLSKSIMIDNMFFLTFTKSENSLVNTLLTGTTYWMHQQLMRKRWQYKNCKLHWFQAYKKEI